MNKWLPKIAVGLVMLSAVAACGDDSSSDAKETDPFEVVFIGGVSGAFSGITDSELVGVNAAIKQINSEGGVQGRTVELEILDSKGDPTQAVSVLQKRLSSGDKPDLVHAGLSSSEALAMLPVLDRAGIPSWSNAQSPEVDSFPLHRTISQSVDSPILMLANYVKQKGIESVTLLVSADESGDSVIKSVGTAFENVGVETDAVRFNPTDLDQTVPIQQAIAKKSEAIYMDCLGAACAQVLAARGNVPGASETLMLGGLSVSGSAGGPAEVATGKALENFEIQVYAGAVEVPEAERTEQFTSFYKEFLAGKKYGSYPAAAFANGSLLMWAKAAELADSTDPVKMVEAIDSHEWEPGTFPIYLNAKIGWDAGIAHANVPDEAYSFVPPSKQVNGLYPAVAPAR